jgi:flagellar protein FlbD
MTRLTSLNNQPLVVNSDLITFVEEAPNTVLTLVTGEQLVVRESDGSVLDKIGEFRRSMLKQGKPGGVNALEAIEQETGREKRSS